MCLSCRSLLRTNKTRMRRSHGGESGSRRARGRCGVAAMPESSTRHCLSVCVCVCLSVCLPTCLPACLCLSRCTYVHVHAHTHVQVHTCMRPDTSGTVTGLPLIVRDTCTHNVVRYRELQYTYTYPPCIRVLSITHTHIPSYNEIAYAHAMRCRV